MALAHRTRRGRQAEAERNDRRVLDAAREIFAARGADATVAAIAERAGVGMGTLYRRYGSKADLLRHLCMQAMEQSIEAAQTALAATDTWAGLTGYVRTCVAQGSGALAPLAGSVQPTPQMWKTSRHGRHLLEQLVSQASHQGTVRPDITALDIAWLIEFFGRYGPAAPHTDEHAIRQRLLTIALDGLRNRDADPIPGPPPSAQHYEQRWKPRSRACAK